MSSITSASMLLVALGVLTTWAGLLTANPTVIGLSCLILMGVALIRANVVRFAAQR